MKRLLSIILCIGMISSMMVLASCSKEPESVPDTLTEDEIAKFTEESKAEYLNVLTDNKKAIKDYTWQAAASKDSTFVQMQKPVVVADINGDEVPELMFMMKDSDDAKAHMYIYTYGRDGLAEMDYTFQDGKLEDNAIGAGDCYVVYLGEDNRLCIYKSHGDDKFVATVSSYVFNGNAMTCEYTVAKTDSIIVDDKGMFQGFEETFEKDGELVDSSKGEKKFDESINGFKSILIYSGYDGTDLFKKFNSDMAGIMSYDDAVSQLSK